MKYRDWHNRAVELSEKGMSKHHEMVGEDVFESLMNWTVD